MLQLSLSTPIRCLGPACGRDPPAPGPQSVRAIGPDFGAPLQGQAAACVFPHMPVPMRPTPIVLSSCSSCLRSLPETATDVPPLVLRTLKPSTDRSTASGRALLEHQASSGAGDRVTRNERRTASGRIVRALIICPCGPRGRVTGQRQYPTATPTSTGVAVVRAGQTHQP